jgi:HEXXH motif-containing protein
VNYLRHQPSSGSYVRLFRLAESPRELAKRVLQRLAESFDYIASAADSADLRQKLRLVAARLGELRVVPPQLGCLYLQIVEAVEGGDEPAASRLCDQLLAILSQSWNLEVARYSRKELGGFYQGFADLLFDESYGLQPITEPPEPIWLQSKAHFERAFELLRAVDPTVYEEIEAFWSRVYVGVPNADSHQMRFGGVSSLILWGGTFVNAEHYDTALKAADFLVHEVTHFLLFALASDAPLVLNPPNQFFPSPLRKDPRPMDGIFHATLVCARVAEFYALIREANTAVDLDDGFLLQLADANVEKFWRGRATIKEFGLISPLGQDLLEQAEMRLQMLQNGR